MRADLHVHTTASDGTLSPSEVVNLASDRGLDAIAVTDHDSCEGVGPALRTAESIGLILIPAVEFSSYRDGLDVHILGYHLDHTDPSLVDVLLRLRHARLERALSMIVSLRDAGYGIDPEDVLRLAAGGSVGRSHIARVLVNDGHVSSIQQAFERILGRKRPHYVAKSLTTPEDVISLVRGYGGIPILAHPGVGSADTLIDSLVDAGLAGIEAYHPEHSEETSARLVDVAEQCGLVVTGGSDFHGPVGSGPDLASVLAPPDAVERLASLATSS
jgi:predicted metal-dependent phosphoesterase TrpH